MFLLSLLFLIVCDCSGREGSSERASEVIKVGALFFFVSVEVGFLPADIMRFISCLRWQGYFSDEPYRICFRSQSFSIFIEAIWPQLLHFQDYSCRACLFIWVTIKEPERAAVIRNWLIGTRCIWRPAWLTEVSVKTYGLCWYNVCVYSLKKKIYLYVLYIIYCVAMLFTISCQTLCSVHKPSLCESHAISLHVWSCTDTQQSYAFA